MGMKKKEIDLVKFFEEQNEYLHKTYGDWVSMVRTQDGFVIKVESKSVDVVATLEKLGVNLEAALEKLDFSFGSPFVNMLVKLRDSIADGTYVPR
jgi:hypothetical protein